MEIQAITPRIDNTVPNVPAQPEQNRGLTEELNQRTATPRAPIVNDEQNLELSDNALQLSESFRNREVQNINTAPPVTEPEQANEIVRQTADLIKQFPSNGLAAQSNLTSSVVKGLLG
ncbi:hypothetical protein [Methylotuvimicrobium buryatense]|uniref:Uncharacterized protein n=1 Tax=Methylotuvimicrobium buryatense TaxID=95641 RepID=A0A4P9UN03_METBY|nr:hypothetical protein [Methylotuvimicrobium buryatense]QCW81843.1 hypothetical protein EQU24_05950 [Methylotuvimicrobium buryatense]